MTSLTLKTYQQNALNALHEYLQLAVKINSADDAFYQYTRRTQPQRRGLAYLSVDQLPGLPYVCLRIPTGGGKTIVACHAISVAAQDFLRQERAVVLWLVPTNTIKAQTLAALRDRQHPYRQALDSTMEAGVTILDLTQAQYMTRPTLDSTTTVIVSTLAALRVEDTNGRKVYEQNGHLMAHFRDLTDEAAAPLDKYENGKPIPSLANLLKLRRPIMVIDEAHNARTGLSFDTLARFNPSCILEFTATPDQLNNPSNVLYHVSASELKAEHMIKMPIDIENRPDWKATLIATIEKRNELEQLAVIEREATGEYIRPIALVQAQANSKTAETLTVEKLKAALLDMKVPEEHIAIETGTIHELDGKQILAETCPIRYILTVDKLREGWDCPFAYILCSVRATRSPRAVEQLLGRVLRMPQAKRKTQEALNIGYARAASPHMLEVAAELQDALVSIGFTKFEADQAVSPPLQHTMEDILGALGGAADARLPSPSERGERFEVPQLAFRFGDVLEPVDESYLLPGALKLDKCDPVLTDDEFPSKQRVEKALLDVDTQGRQKLAGYNFVTELQQQLTYLTPHDIGSVPDLVVWLDRHVPHADTTQTQAQRFLLRMINHLMQERGFTLDELSRKRLALRDAATSKIQQFRRQVKATSYQQLLFDQPAEELEVGPECVFRFDPLLYTPSAPYRGNYAFSKHYYPIVGKMDSDEEADCALRLDALPVVKYWVRNLDRRPNAFWLQTATDKFYPDLIAKLEDGRTLVVEYKGADRLTTDDTREKKALGELWEQRSNGQCLFMLVSRNDYAARLQSLIH